MDDFRNKIQAIRKLIKAKGFYLCVDNIPEKNSIYQISNHFGAAAAGMAARILVEKAEEAVQQAINIDAVNDLLK